MHTMVLGFAGYGLLLSSCVTLAFLLRIGCLKDVMQSPLRILSTSDTLISVFTSIILLVNQSLLSFNFVQESPMAAMSKIADRQLLPHQGGKEYYQNQTCMRLDIRDTNESTPNCTFQHVLMHYAMFLVPFANAFISLLIYSIQCSTGMTCITKKCLKLVKMSTNFEIGSIGDTQKRELNDQKDVNEIYKDPEAGMSDGKKREAVLTISEGAHLFSSLKKNRKFTGFGLTTQWLVPMLTAAILYFSKTQDMNNMRGSGDMDCIFKVNFPLESCFKSGSFQPKDQINEEKNYGISTGYSGVEDPDSLRISHPDSKEIDEVVSRVRNLIQSALNKTCNNGTNLKDHRDFKSWNITEYIIVNNVTQEIKSHGVKILEKLNNQSLGISGSDECLSVNGNDSSSEGTELFEDEELDSSPNLVGTSELISTVEEIETSDSDFVKVTTDNDNVTENIEIINQTEASVHKVSADNKQVNINVENTTKKLNDEIRTEIIKQIRNVVRQVKTREKTGSKQVLNYDKFNSGLFDERSKVNGIQTFLLKLEESRARKDNNESTENVFSKIKGDRQSQVLDNKNQHCFLSQTFLKIYLLILLFSVYFLPVLISAVLQTRAMYMCENVFEKIESANQKFFSTPAATRQPSDSSGITHNENPSKSGWFSEGIDSVKTISTDNLGMAHNIEDIESPKINSYKQENRKIRYKNMLEETRSMQTLFAILKKSLILGMLMWTPAFLEILSKVFMCTSTPAWLSNGLYLLGISFGIVKNFLNVSIAKIDKNISDQIHGKDNSIHPSAQQ